MAWSRDGRLAAFAGLDTTVHVRDAATGAAVWELSGHAGHVYSLAFAPDGKTLASGGGRWFERRATEPDFSGKPEVKLWDLATGKEAGRGPPGTRT